MDPRRHSMASLLEQLRAGYGPLQWQWYYKYYHWQPLTEPSSHRNRSSYYYFCPPPPPHTHTPFSPRQVGETVTGAQQLVLDDITTEQKEQDELLDAMLIVVEDLGRKALVAKDELDKSNVVRHRWQPAHELGCVTIVRGLQRRLFYSHDASGCAPD